MKRNIVQIDESLCDGCGECIVACHEGALQIIDGKARLISDIYCDGLGDCLGECPQGAITMEERESLAYDQAAVDQRLEIIKQREAAGDNLPSVQTPVSAGCPGARAMAMDRIPASCQSAPAPSESASRLAQWPCQLKLVSPNAPYLSDAHLLIAADCTAYAYPTIHEDFMKGRVTLIGCPKLDDGDYRDKLIDIFSLNRIKSVTVVKMVVPCCGGLAHAAVDALQRCGKMIPWNMVTIHTDGTILED